MAIPTCRYYPDEHYATVFNPTTGFFARIEDAGYPDPFCSYHGPELIDISITGWCDKECATCYRSASTKGQHMSTDNYEVVLRQAARLQVAQVALGGGNPNQHPEFPTILKLTRDKYGIVPNYTTNGRGLTDEIIQATCAHCGAVAISAYQPYTEMAELLKKFSGQPIKVNVHFTLDSKSVETAITWILDPPAFLSGVNAIIFLNYKPIGRGGDSSRLLKYNSKIQEFIEVVLNKQTVFKVGFDSCMISALATSKVSPIWYDSCEAARFSMYVSDTMRVYPCSFMETFCEGTVLNEENMLDIWLEDPVFQHVRNILKQPRCKNCTCIEICKGGCPIYPDINLCGQRV